MGVGSAPKPQRSRGRLLAILVVLAIVAGGALYATFGATNAAAATATVAVVRTAMQAQHGASGFVLALDGDVLTTGDRVRTDASGRGFLTFFDGSTLEVEPGAQVTVTDLSRSGDGSFVIRIQQTLGRTWASIAKLANPNSRFEIETPSATAVVRGTAFETSVQADGTTTVQTHEGTVAVSAQGATQQAASGTQVTTPAGGTPGAPQLIPPGPGLRFSSPDGTSLTAFDPNGLACGSGRGDAPGCTTGGVLLKRVTPGTYTLLMRSSAAVNATLTMEGQFGTSTVATQALTRAMSRGDLVRTSVAVTLDGQGRPALGAPTPFEIVSSVCAGEASGRVFAAGKLEERGAALQQFAAANKGQAVSIVFNDAELNAAAQEALKDLHGLPVTITEASVRTTVGGVTMTANVALGPLSIRASARFAAGADGGRLVLHLRDLDLGPFTGLVGQARANAEDTLSNAGDDLPLAVQRVAFRDGCVAIIGATR